MFRQRYPYTVMAYLSLFRFEMGPRPTHLWVHRLCFNKH